MLKWIFFAASFSVMLCAQMPHGGVWWEGKVAQDLNLTEAQQKQIAAIRKEYSHRFFDLREVVNKAEGELEIVFNESSVDQRKSNEAIERLVAARADLFRATSQFELKLRTVLTAEQWQEVKKRSPRGGPGSRGPGGPDGGSSRRRGGPAPKGAPPVGQQQNP
jgi:Spy/CpxP family protein refolding chaperone